MRQMLTWNKPSFTRPTRVITWLTLTCYEQPSCVVRVLIMSMFVSQHSCVRHIQTNKIFLVAGFCKKDLMYCETDMDMI